MATSAKPQLPSEDNNVQVLGLGLGDITIGLGSNATGSQDIPGLNNLVDMHASADSKLMSAGLSSKHEAAAKAGMDSLAYSNQISQMLPTNTSPKQIIGQKAQEDLFVKNNLEYEQRLKAHLYQFEEDDRKNRTRSIDDSQASERQESRAFNRETPGGGVDGGTS